MSAFVEQERGRFGVEPICRELEVSARAYRERRRGRLSRRGQRDKVLLAEIRRVHAESDSSYGSWRCWKQLNRDGVQVARCTVERLMRTDGLIGVVRGKTQRTTLPGSSPVPAADLVKRRFTASRPDELWVCDFTTTSGAIFAAITKPRSRADPVRSRTAHVSANGVTASPRRETSCPEKKSRNWRS